MNGSELALKMLEYEKIYHQLEALGAEIKAAVLEAGSTQKVGNVTASYSGGRKTFDYVTAAKDKAPAEIIDKFTTTETIIKTDWRQVCQEWGCDIPFTQSEPSVTLKIV